MPISSDAGDPPPDEVDPQDRVDRDERRVRALQRLFRGAHEGERRLSAAAMKKIGNALRGETPPD